MMVLLLGLFVSSSYLGRRINIDACVVYTQHGIRPLLPSSFSYMYLAAMYVAASEVDFQNKPRNKTEQRACVYKPRAFDTKAPNEPPRKDPKFGHTPLKEPLTAL